MIIRSSKANKPSINVKSIKKVELIEENKTVISETNRKKKNKKTIPTPVVEETPVVVEEKTEDEDLSKWLEEHTED